MPQRLVDVDTFSKAIEIIDTLFKSEELVEVDGQVVNP